MNSVQTLGRYQRLLYKLNASIQWAVGSRPGSLTSCYLLIQKLSFSDGGNKVSRLALSTHGLVPDSVSHGLSRMRTEALSNPRRRGEKRAIRSTNKGKGAGSRGPAKAFVSDVPARHHLGIRSRCPKFGGPCRSRHGSAPRSEDAGCQDSAMVSAASPRSRRLQSPQARALRPPAVGWGLGTPGVLSRVPGPCEGTRVAPPRSPQLRPAWGRAGHWGAAGHGPGAEAPRGVWGSLHILATSCSERTRVSWTVPATSPPRPQVTWPQ